MTGAWRGPRIEIRSGGQTGVDRAALDAALTVGLPCGGWCPRCRRAEDGVILRRYPLRCVRGGYAQRTRANVRDSDGTLILHRGAITGGTRLTLDTARRLNRPVFAANVRAEPAAVLARRVGGWLIRHRIRRLNVAGPRESEEPGVYREARALLDVLFRTAPFRSARRAGSRRGASAAWDGRRRRDSPAE